MTTAVELKAQRTNTAAFIAAKPVRIVLVSSTKTKTATGGWKFVDGEPRKAQTFRLLPQTGFNAARIRTQDGVEMHADYVLLGAYDATVAAGDYWADGDKTYRVIYLLPENGYETRALVSVDGAA